MTDRATGDLIALDKIARQLAEATDLKDVKSIRDKAEAVRKYAQSANLEFKLQNQAAELKLRAERRAGALLAETVSPGGDRRPSSQDGRMIKLADLGINYNQSARWQMEAGIPDRVFELYLATANERGEDITTAGLLRLARGRSVRTEKSRRQSTGSFNFKGGPRRHRASETATDGVARAGHRNGAPPTYREPEEGESSIAELLDELGNHRVMLAEILRPICDGQKFAPELAKRRLVARLLGEFEQMLVDLRRHWVAQSDSAFQTNGVVYNVFPKNRRR